MRYRADAPHERPGNGPQPDRPPPSAEDIAAYREWMKRPPRDPLHQLARRRLAAAGETIGEPADPRGEQGNARRTGRLRTLRE